MSAEPRIPLASDLGILAAQCQVEIGVHGALAAIKNSIEDIGKEQLAVSMQESNAVYFMPSVLSGFPAKSLALMDSSKLGVELSAKSCCLTANALQIFSTSAASVAESSISIR